MYQSILAAITKYQTRQLVNNRNLFLTILEAGSPRSGYQHGQMRSAFRSQTSHYVIIWERGKEGLLGFLFKGINVIYKDSALMT